MALFELAGSGEAQFTTRGASLRRQFICDWSERFDVAPKIGQAYPDWPVLRVTEVTFTGVGTPHADGSYDKCKIEVIYSAERFPAINAPLEIAVRGATEALKLGIGYEFQDTGEIIEASDLNLAVPVPFREWTITGTRREFPAAIIDSLLGRVNASPFHGAAAETLLFTSYDSQRIFDFENNDFYYTFSLHLIEKRMSHNLVWRCPTPDVDANGNIMRWQNKDPQAPNYTTDTRLVGRLVYKPGPAGRGAWTKTVPPLYEAADFSILDTI